jgi:hypothetical protein
MEGRMLVETKLFITKPLEMVVRAFPLVVPLVEGFICQQSAFLWNSFKNHKRITKWSKWKSYGISNNFNVNNMKICGRHIMDDKV